MRTHCYLVLHLHCLFCASKYDNDRRR